MTSPARREGSRAIRVFVCVCVCVLCVSIDKTELSTHPPAPGSRDKVITL